MSAAMKKESKDFDLKKIVDQKCIYGKINHNCFLRNWQGEVRKTKYKI